MFGPGEIQDSEQQGVSSIARTQLVLNYGRGVVARSNNALLDLRRGPKVKNSTPIYSVRLRVVY